MNRSHRTFVTAFIFALISFTGAPAVAQTYPTKPIVLISWSAAGSPVDVMAREIAKLAPKYLHQNMVVEDKTGGDGANAMQYLLGQPADGYTLLCNTRSLMATLNTDLKDKFTPAQFDFLATLETDPYVIAVKNDSPFKSLRDLVKTAKVSPITIGGFGADSAAAMFARRFAAESGAKFTWVPFPGGSAALATVLGGHISSMLGNVSEMRAQVDAGAMRVLAASTSAGSAGFSGAVSMPSLGYRDLAVSHWRGVMGKQGLPADVAAKLEDFFRRVTRDPEFQAYVKATGLVSYFNDRTAFAKLVRADMESMAKEVGAK